MPQARTARCRFSGRPVPFAPEGPVAPAADVYSLGRVIYEVSTGVMPDQFPELPMDVSEREAHGLFRQLNLIIGRACEPDPEFRHRTAAELEQDLARLLGSV